MYKELKAVTNEMSGGSIKRTQVEFTLESTMSSIRDDVIPSVEALIAHMDTVPVIKDSTILYRLAGLPTVKARDTRTLLLNLKGLLTEFELEERNLAKLISKNVSKLMLVKTMTAKEAMIISTIKDMFSIAVYINDLCYITLLEDNSTDLPEIKLKEVYAGIPTLAAGYSHYRGNTAKIVAGLKKVSDSVLNRVDNAEPSMMDKVLASTGLFVSLPPLDKFKGNPVWHVGMWWEDRKVAKYELQKEKKQLLDLKLVELRLRADGSEDKSLTKQIQYYEDKVSGVEYDIGEFEESL